MNKQTDLIITCPICGEQYLFSEIFMPNSFFGKQHEIHKTQDGKLDFYLGDDPDLNEEFICEHCLTKLKIHANVTFDVQVDKEENFEEEYSSPINKQPKIKLEEPQIFNC